MPRQPTASRVFVSRLFSLSRTDTLQETCFFEHLWRNESLDVSPSFGISFFVDSFRRREHDPADPVCELFRWLLFLANSQPFSVLGAANHHVKLEVNCRNHLEIRSSWQEWCDLGTFSNYVTTSSGQRETWTTALARCDLSGPVLVLPVIQIRGCDLFLEERFVMVCMIPLGFQQPLI